LTWSDSSRRLERLLLEEWVKFALARWSFLHYPAAIPPTIANLLDDPELGLTLRSAGGNLNAPVQWVYVTDLRDPSAYLSAGDLVATNGLWRRRRSDSETFVERLAAGRACGLVYGLAQRTTETPEDLIEACARHGLVLLELAHPHAFSALAKAVAAEQAAERRRELDQALRRQDALVHALTRGAGPRGVLDVLLRQNGLSALVLDAPGRAIEPRRAPTRARELAAAREALATPHDPVTEPRGLVLANGREVSATCLAGSALHGHLVCDRPLAGLTEDDCAALEQARQFLEVELQRIEAVRSERAKFAAELIDLIEAGEPRFGLPCERGLCVLAVALEPEADDGTVLAAADWCFERLGHTAVVAVRDGEILAFVAAPAGASCADALAPALAAALAGHAVRVGVGSVATDVRVIYRSLSEARHSLCLTSHAQPVVDHSALASHQALMDLQDPEIAHAFERTLIAPLEEHDHRRGTALVETLEVFLDEGGHWKRSAERLHVHVNTLRHRLDRVSALTDRDLSTMDARVDFHLALDARRRCAGAPQLEAQVGALAKPGA
jgi:purine catabolism regulator